MSETVPATPAKAATPGEGEPGNQPNSAGAPPVNAGQQGNQPEGTVTIPTKEYAELQRFKARQTSFERRGGFSKRNQPNSGEPADPNAEQDRLLAEANAKALRAEITLEVRDILEKPEYADLPASTRALILKNPHLISEADNKEDALDDIEEFIAGEAAKEKALKTAQQQNGGGQAPGSRAAEPAGHETPRAVATPTPAATPAVGLEDTSRLTGAARSQAVLRNLIRTKKGVKSE